MFWSPPHSSLCTGLDNSLEAIRSSIFRGASTAASETCYFYPTGTLGSGHYFMVSFIDEANLFTARTNEGLSGFLSCLELLDLVHRLAGSLPA